MSIEIAVYKFRMEKERNNLLRNYRMRYLRSHYCPDYFRFVHHAKGCEMSMVIGNNVMNRCHYYSEKIYFASNKMQQTVFDLIFHFLHEGMIVKCVFGTVLKKFP